MHLIKNFKIPEELGATTLLDELLDEIDEFDNDEDQMIGDDEEMDDDQSTTDSESTSSEMEQQRIRDDPIYQEVEQLIMASSSSSESLRSSSIDEDEDMNKQLEGIGNGSGSGSGEQKEGEDGSRNNNDGGNSSTDSDFDSNLDSDTNTDTDSDSGHDLENMRRMMNVTSNDDLDESNDQMMTMMMMMDNNSADKMDGPKPSSSSMRRLSSKSGGNKLKQVNKVMTDNDLINDTNTKGLGEEEEQEKGEEEEEETQDLLTSRLIDFNEDDEQDETVVGTMLSSIRKTRTKPPEIKLDDFITDVCFHPAQDIIAAATVVGDVHLYEYADNGNKLLRTIEIHGKSCRDVEFTEDGMKLLTCSKDRSIMVTDMYTEKLLKFYENAHDNAINRLHVINENLFATGDDDGMVKLWDLRTRNEIFGLKEVEDYITALHTNNAGKLLLVTSGDGYLTTLNIGSRKLYVQSEPYEEELTCMNTFRGDSKLVVGTSKGNLYTFNWGQFGYHSDKFPGHKTPIGHMIPITDRMSCVGGEDGVIMAVHVAPFRLLGVVGQHEMAIESMDVSWNGELIATCSHNNDLRFWNVKYFEDFRPIRHNEKHNRRKEKSHNLPSSKYSNAGDFFADLN